MKISKAGIEEANARAKNFRLLNQPDEAESGCLDVLIVDPKNQTALRNLALAITDQFTGEHDEDRQAGAEGAASTNTSVSITAGSFSSAGQKRSFVLASLRAPHCRFLRRR